MTDEVRHRLEQRKRHATLYELAAIKGEDRVLLSYCALSRTCLLAAVRKRAEFVCALTGAREITFGKHAADGAAMGEWAIRFTGRTEREAITHGELPWILDYVQSVRSEAQ